MRSSSRGSSIAPVIGAGSLAGEPVRCARAGEAPSIGAMPSPIGSNSPQHFRVGRVFGQRKMVTLALLGFASGLPLYLTSRTLQAWMHREGVDLTTIGVFSLVALPYSL